MPDVGIERARGEGLNSCAVRVTNHGDLAARDVTVHVVPGSGPYMFGTLAPVLLHVVTTSNGDGNWTDNALYFEL